MRGKESAQVGAAAIAAPWTWAKKIGIECHHRQERAGAAGGAVLGAIGACAAAPSAALALYLGDVRQSITDCLQPRENQTAYR